jgi:hypothetical protein
LPGTDILLFLLTAGIVVSAEIAAMRAQWVWGEHNFFAELVKWTITRIVCCIVYCYLTTTKQLRGIKSGCLCGILTDSERISIFILWCKWFRLKVINREKFILQWQFTILLTISCAQCTSHCQGEGKMWIYSPLCIEDEYLFYTLIEPLGSNGWSSSFGVNLILRTTCKFADEMGYSLKCFFCKLSAE